MAVGDRIYYQLSNHQDSLGTSTALIEDIPGLLQKTNLTNKFTATIPVDEKILELQAHMSEANNKNNHFFVALTSRTSMYYSANISGLVEKSDLGTKCLASGLVSPKRLLCLQAIGEVPQTRDIDDLKVVLLPAADITYSDYSHQGNINKHLFFPRISKGADSVRLSQQGSLKVLYYDELRAAEHESQQKTTYGGQTIEVHLNRELGGSTIEMIRLTDDRKGSFRSVSIVDILVAFRETSGAIVTYKCPVYKNITESVDCKQFDKQQPAGTQETLSVISMLAQGDESAILRVAYAIYNAETKTSTSVRRTYTYSVSVNKEGVITETEPVLKTADEIFLAKSTLLLAEANSPGVIALSSESKVQAYQAELVLFPTSAPVFYIFYPTDPSLVSPGNYRVLVDERAAVLVIATESSLSSLF